MKYIVTYNVEEDASETKFQVVFNGIVAPDMGSAIRLAEDKVWKAFSLIYYTFTLYSAEEMK